MGLRSVTALLTTGVILAGLSACGGGGSGGTAGDGGAAGAGGEGGTGGTGGSMGGSGGTGGAPPPPAKVKIGDTCNADDDCGTDEICLAEGDSFTAVGPDAGGPAGGYCTKQCADDDECGPGNYCVGEFCFQGCEQGPDLMFLDDPLDEDKCFGRDNVRCQELAQAGFAVCIPNCNTDDECNGRVCDPTTKTCVDMPGPGKPVGDACDPDAMTSECAGICLQFAGDTPNDPGPTMCSTTCVLGGDFEFDCGGLDKGLCAFSSQGAGPGDTGFCTEACTQQSDCQNPTFWCFSIGIQGLGNGFCFGASDCVTDADCMGMTDQCTDTAFGKKCLDPTFPLPAAPKANVRVAHLSPDAPAVDFCLSGDGGATFTGPVLKSLGDTDGLKYPEVTQYLSVDAAAYTVRIVAPNAANCNTALAGLPDTTLAALVADESYTVGALGLLTPGMNAAFGLEAYLDDTTVGANEIRLTFTHASPDAPAVDVGIYDPATMGFTALFQNQSYPDAASLLTSPTPALQIAARAAGDPNNVIVVDVPALAAGARVSAFAIGQLTANPSTLDVLACLDHTPAANGLSNCVILPKVP